jgi:hypothetical protein
LAHNIIGHVSKGVTEPVLTRVFEYRRNVDPDLGKKVEQRVRAQIIWRQRRVVGRFPRHLAQQLDVR